MSTIDALLKQSGASFEADEDFDAANAYCRERGWTDGLPVVPPTRERVERMLTYCDRPLEQPVLTIPPRFGAATPLKLAANAVMAGCLPEHFPLVMLALETMTAEGFNLYGIQATTHPCAPLIIVNGPVAQELGMNSGASALGIGTHANAAIGRAARLALLNIGGAIPGLGDMCTYGVPTKYSYCAAENEAANPWEPLHVERGFAPSTTTITVVAAEPPHNINDHESTNAEGVLMSIAGNMSIPACNDIHYAIAEPVLLLCPEHAASLAAGGYSKADIRRYIYENARVPLRRFSPENVDRRLRLRFPEEFGNADLDATVPIVKKPENLIIAVIGGAGKHSAFIPTFGNTRSATRALKHADGRLVASIHDLRHA